MVGASGRPGVGASGPRPLRLQAGQADDPRPQLLLRGWKADVELFRDENVPLQTELSKLNSQYDKLIGAMTVTYEGHPYTLQQMARYQEEPDRTLRRRTRGHTVAPGPAWYLPPPP